MCCAVLNARGGLSRQHQPPAPGSSLAKVLWQLMGLTAHIGRQRSQAPFPHDHLAALPARSRKPRPARSASTPPWLPCRPTPSSHWTRCMPPALATSTPSWTRPPAARGPAPGSNPCASGPCRTVEGGWRGGLGPRLCLAGPRGKRGTKKVGWGQGPGTYSTLQQTPNAWAGKRSLHVAGTLEAELQRKGPLPPPLPSIIPCCGGVPSGNTLT